MVRTDLFSEVGIQFDCIDKPLHLQFLFNVKHRVQESFCNAPPQMAYLHKFVR